MICRYVLHERVHDYFAVGWHILIANPGPTTGERAVIMAWLCGCKCVEPL